MKKKRYRVRVSDVGKFVRVKYDTEEMIGLLVHHDGSSGRFVQVFFPHDRALCTEEKSQIIEVYENESEVISNLINELWPDCLVTNIA